MKKVYKVKVNGKVYEVEVEAVDEVKGNVEASAPVKNDAPAVTVAANSDKSIVAPIAGKVIDLKVKVGDQVKAGQTVAIIEAMKLENEIQSAFDGTVAEIKVNKGSSVANKDVLIVLG